MEMELPKITQLIQAEFELPLSKSMANRGLLLAAIFPEITLTAISTAKDSVLLRETLDAYAHGEVHVGAGGTTLRFATAYWATREGSSITLGGTTELNQRPIAPLVDALNALGAEITYANTHAEAPLHIKGRQLQGGSLHLGHVKSSQFVTALMLIAPTMRDGLRLEWDSVVSQPYLVMTAALLRSAGIPVTLTKYGVSIPHVEAVDPVRLVIERDWSAVAFWCEALALSVGGSLTLPGFVDTSNQGDSKVVHYFEPLGIGHKFTEDGLVLSKKSVLTPGHLHYNLQGEPDLAQPLIMTLLLKKIPFEVHGLETLRGKECDRIAAIAEVADALGIELETGEAHIKCSHYPDRFVPISQPLQTHNDHRVAMSLAPLAFQFPITLLHPSVVEKSYPDFWQHWAQLV
jgi:3-phosphoshikimate 1-carboxyvinyltransferase